jgi:hypothetical protein
VVSDASTSGTVYSRELSSESGISDATTAKTTPEPAKEDSSQLNSQQEPLEEAIGENSSVSIAEKLSSQSSSQTRSYFFPKPAGIPSIYLPKSQEVEDEDSETELDPEEAEWEHMVYYHGMNNWETDDYERYLKYLAKRSNENHPHSPKREEEGWKRHAKVQTSLLVAELEEVKKRLDPRQSFKEKVMERKVLLESLRQKTDKDTPVAPITDVKVASVWKEMHRTVQELGKPDEKRPADQLTRKKYFEFKSKHLAQGRTLKDIVAAVFATIADFPMAGYVLAKMNEHGGKIPEDVPGVWTKQDDEILLNGINDLKPLEKKHGFDPTAPVKLMSDGGIRGKKQRDPCALRMLFLQKWRFCNLIEEDIDSFMESTPGVKVYEDMFSKPKRSKQGDLNST